jgi:cytochrome c oxidase assembly factor CtaG
LIDYLNLHYIICCLFAIPKTYNSVISICAISLVQDKIFLVAGVFVLFQLLWNIEQSKRKLALYRLKCVKAPLCFRCALFSKYSLYFRQLEIWCRCHANYQVSSVKEASEMYSNFIAFEAQRFPIFQAAANSFGHVSEKSNVNLPFAVKRL